MRKWYFYNNGILKENLTKEEAILFFLPIWESRQDESFWEYLETAINQGCSAIAVGGAEIGFN